MFIKTQSYTKHIQVFWVTNIGFVNPLNAELNPICHLLTLLGAHPILHVRISHHQTFSLSRPSGETYLCKQDWDLIPLHTS